MISLDTNLLLRFLLNDVPIQTKQVETLFQNNQQLYVTDVVITETVYVLETQYKLARQIIVDLLIELLDMQQLISNPYFLPQVLHDYKNKPALSFTDCYAANEARYYQNELYTFDKKLANQGGSHVRLVP